MTHDGTDALEQALALRAVPGRLPILRSRPLPANVLSLIELVGGRGETIRRCAAATSETPRVLVDAATLYIQQVLFDEDSDHYRVLGVRATDPAEIIHEHHRWLLRWLHPDRQPGRWETGFSERVNVAWNVLRSPERRDEYDAWLAASPQRTPAAGRGLALAPAPPVAAAGRVMDKRPWLSTSTVQRLPTYALAGLAATAIAWVAISYQGQPRAFSSSAVGAAALDEPSDDVAARAAREALRVGEDPDGPSDAAMVSQAVDGTSSGIADSMRQPPAENIGTTTSADVAASAVADVSRPDEPRTAAPSLAAADAAPIAQPQVSGEAGVTAGRSATSREVEPRSAASTQSMAVMPLAITRQSHRPAAGTASPVVIVSSRGNEANPRTLSASTPPRPLPAANEPNAAVTAAERPVDPVAPSATADRSPASKQADAGIAARAVDRTSVPPSAPAPMATMPAEDAARWLPRRFSAAYADGDFPRMMALFTRDAVENRDGIDAIARDYRRLFDRTSSRELQLDELVWSIQPRRIVGSGSYEGTVLEQGRLEPRKWRGWIRIEAVPVNGVWKIRNLQHKDAR